jgi:hypothetical protein
VNYCGAPIIVVYGGGTETYSEGAIQTHENQLELHSLDIKFEFPPHY